MAAHQEIDTRHDIQSTETEPHLLIWRTNCSCRPFPNHRSAHGQQTHHVDVAAFSATDHPPAAAHALRRAGGGEGPGGDRVRRLDGRHGQQQLHLHGHQERLRALRPRPPGGRRRRNQWPAHRPVLQRPPRRRLHLRGFRAATARAGVSGPQRRHEQPCDRRLLRLRRRRLRQRHL